jgi:hypothetical protein
LVVGLRRLHLLSRHFAKALDRSMHKLVPKCLIEGGIVDVLTESAVLLVIVLVVVVVLVLVLVLVSVIGMAR